MALSPEDVNSQQFRLEFRGYNQEEVDTFLERVVESISELTTARDRVEERLRDVESKAASALESEDLLRRTLIAAQRTADETVNEARTESEQLREEARVQAEEVLESARRDADALRADVEREIGESRHLASTGVQRVHQAVEELRRFHEEYRERVQAVIAEQLAVLDRVGDLPDLSPALDRLAEVSADAEAHAEHAG